MKAPISEATTLLSKYYFLHTPLDPDNYLLYRDLPEKYLRGVALGESFTSFNEYIAFQETVKTFQIDVTHLGGFNEAIKVLNYFGSRTIKNNFTSHVWGSKVSLLLNLALCKACNLINWFEIPLLNFEINDHLFESKVFDPRALNDKDIDMLLSNLNIKQSKKYEFISGSGYRI